jgi:hypothetical protein
MAVTSTNILKAALDTLTVDSVDMGGTFEPMEVNTEVTIEDISVEQFKSPIRSVIDARTVGASVVLAEMTLANLAIVMNLPAANIVSSSLTIDSSDRGVVTWIAVGKSGSAPGTNIKRTFNFPRSRATGTPTYNIAKLEPSQIPVEWSFLAETTNGIIGTVLDSPA